jgi:alcohol dehydrogenase YqhD (iron-dependent ADH family)
LLFIEYGGIKANPDIEDVLKIVAMAKEFRPDLILACGGGSVLDTAKSVAHGYYYEGNPLDFNKKTVKPLHALPIGTVITVCASGSEMSNSCVISDRVHGFKGGFNAVTNYPLFSLLDPTITYTVSPYQTAIGLVDMFSHSFERYFSPSHPIEPCDDLALAVMKDVVEVSPKVIADPNDYDARRAMMILGSLAHDGFTNYGKAMFFRVHGAEHRLSGAHPELPHGQGIALLLVPYLEANKTLFKDKIRKMGVEVFGLKKSSTVKAVLAAFSSWLDSLPITHSFEELPSPIPEDEIRKAYALLKVK